MARKGEAKGEVEAKARGSVAVGSKKGGKEGALAKEVPVVDALDRKGCLTRQETWGLEETCVHAKWW